MGPGVFSTPEQAWLARLPAQVSALPCSTQFGLASTPVERLLLPGSWTKGSQPRASAGEGLGPGTWVDVRAEAGVGGRGGRNTALSSREDSPGVIGVVVRSLGAQGHAECWKTLR